MSEEAYNKIKDGLDEIYSLVTNWKSQYEYHKQELEKLPDAEKTEKSFMFGFFSGYARVAREFIRDIEQRKSEQEIEKR